MEPQAHREPPEQLALKVLRVFKGPPDWMEPPEQLDLRVLRVWTEQLA
jgi:hypothetical protein